MRASRGAAHSVHRAGHGRSRRRDEGGDEPVPRGGLEEAQARREGQRLRRGRRGRQRDDRARAQGRREAHQGVRAHGPGARQHERDQGAGRGGAEDVAPDVERVGLVRAVRGGRHRRALQGQAAQGPEADDARHEGLRRRQGGQGHERARDPEGGREEAQGRERRPVRPEHRAHPAHAQQGGRQVHAQEEWAGLEFDRTGHWCGINHLVLCMEDILEEVVEEDGYRAIQDPSPLLNTF